MRDRIALDPDWYTMSISSALVTFCSVRQGDAGITAAIAVELQLRAAAADAHFWERCSQTSRAGRTKSPDWFPVTAELCSTIRERLRGVLVDARLGVTGKGYGAHGLSGRRPIANSFSPSRSRRGSTHP